MTLPGRWGHCGSPKHQHCPATWQSPQALRPSPFHGTAGGSSRMLLALKIRASRPTPMPGAGSSPLRTQEPAVPGGHGHLLMISMVLSFPHTLPQAPHFPFALPLINARPSLPSHNSPCSCTLAALIFRVNLPLSWQWHWHPSSSCPRAHGGRNLPFSSSGDLPSCKYRTLGPDFVLCCCSL